MLTILNVAFPLAPAGPDAVGGAEQVLSRLDQALIAAGHQSLVVACAGTKSAGTLLSTGTVPEKLTDSARADAYRRHRQTIARALDRWPVDVVHLHGIDCCEYLPPPGVPVLVTLHLPPAWYPPEIFRLSRPRTYLHCVSPAQRRACPPCAAMLPVIENGVPVPARRPPHAKRRFALALGRICPEKGFHHALDAARQADAPLWLAGRVFGYETHQEYYQREIEPRLDSARRFIGPVGLKRKQRLLTAAQCLLAPSLAPETSSLAAMEALAAGTPVVAFPAGALADIVEPGRTGFLVNSVAEMAAAIPAARHLNPETCRETARQRFSLARMTGQYLRVYQDLKNKERPVCH